MDAKFVILVPTSPNKAGALGSAINSAKRYTDAGHNVQLILNARDKSGNFGTHEELPLLKVSALPHLEPGFVAYRLSRKEPILEVIQRPTESYGWASKWLEDYVLAASETQAFKEVFWWENSLDSLPVRKPLPRLHYACDTMKSVTDAAIDRSVATEKAKKEFCKHPQDSAEFLKAACELQNLFNSK